MKKNKIEHYSKKVGYLLKNIYVIDGSKRSTKANAFFSGLGPKKTIALYDTLIEKHSGLTCDSLKNFKSL